MHGTRHILKVIDICHMKTYSYENDFIPMGGDMATVHDVARHAGVSLATVSRAFNHPELVRPETLERIKEVVEELAYSPSTNARSLRTARAHTVGLVLPSLSNPFFPALIEAASQGFEDHGLSVLVRVADDPIAAAETLDRSNAVDGIVIVGDQNVVSERPRPSRISVPLVAFDRIPSIEVNATYKVDNVHGAETATAHLVSSRPRRILHIAGPRGMRVTAERIEGFECALNNPDCNRIERKIVYGDFSAGSGAEAFEHALAEGFHPDAVFASNDLMAIGAIDRGLSHGLSIPHDLRIAGFDGIDVAQYFRPSLTTYKQPIDRIANATVHGLLTEIDAMPQKGRTKTNDIHLFKGELLIRNSTQPAIA